MFFFPFQSIFLFYLKIFFKKKCKIDYIKLKNKKKKKKATKPLNKEASFSFSFDYFNWIGRNMNIMQFNILILIFAGRIRGEACEPNGVTDNCLIIFIPMPCPLCMSCICHH